MARNAPIRTTENLHLTLPRELAESTKTAAQRLGLTVSDYVSVLLKGQTPIARPAAEMQDVALAGNRIVRAIGGLAASGCEHGDAVKLLREAQRFVAAELRKAEPAYQAAVAAHVKDDAWGEIAL